MGLATLPSDRSDAIKPGRWPVSPTPDFANWTPPPSPDPTDAPEPADDRQPAVRLDDADN